MYIDEALYPPATKPRGVLDLTVLFCMQKDFFDVRDGLMMSDLTLLSSLTESEEKVIGQLPSS